MMLLEENNQIKQYNEIIQYHAQIIIKTEETL